MEDWIAGYLSNFNSLTNDPDVSDFLKDEDWDGLIGWIDNYCAANPSDKLEKAARELELDRFAHNAVDRCGLYASNALGWATTCARWNAASANARRQWSSSMHDGEAVG